MPSDNLSTGAIRPTMSQTLSFPSSGTVTVTVWPAPVLIDSVRTSSTLDSNGCGFSRL